jgi:CheY-specific phosphatase CheX
MSFLFADPVERDEAPPARGAFLHASMEFSGPLSGELHLVAPVSFAREIAANVTGVDVGDIAASSAEDALGELLGVVCAHALAEIAGDKVFFSQSFPNVAATSPAEASSFAANPDTVPLAVDENPLFLGISIRS